MSAPDPTWGRLRKRDGEPIFGEPWHAQAVAMADLLVKSGTLSKSKWAESLGAEIRAAMLAGSPDDTDTYCGAVLSALEHLLDAGKNVSREELGRRRDEWLQAYLNTPHGQPVDLDRSR